jgi:predicted enzyme related to lactoylglutathione lyase
MLAYAHVSTRLPAKDLDRARRFYSEKLGLQPIEERPGGLRYQCGGCSFAVFDSAGTASGTHTQMAWEVDDIETTVAALRARGVVFEDYDMPASRPSTALPTSEGITRARVSANEGRGSETAKGTYLVWASQCVDEERHGIIRNVLRER